jgi:hypothetical protein
MADFSSTQNTAANCGGCMYNPVNVGRLAFEFRVIAGHVTLQSIRLQISPLADPLHAVSADSELRGEFAADQ